MSTTAVSSENLQKYSQISNNPGNLLCGLTTFRKFPVNFEPFKAGNVVQVTSSLIACDEANLFPRVEEKWGPREGSEAKRDMGS